MSDYRLSAAERLLALERRLAVLESRLTGHTLNATRSWADVLRGDDTERRSKDICNKARALERRLMGWEVVLPTETRSWADTLREGDPESQLQEAERTVEYVERQFARAQNPPAVRHSSGEWVNVGDDEVPVMYFL